MARITDHAAACWALTSDRAARVVSHRYDAVVADSPEWIPFWSSPFFWAPFVVVAAALVVPLVAVAVL